MSELDRNLSFPPVDYALTCSPAELEACGFDRRDIARLFLWQDGELKDATDEEIRRFRRLEMLVARTVT